MTPDASFPPDDSVPADLFQTTPPPMTDPQLAAALSHSTRVHILSVLNTRIASAKELAAELDEPIQNLNYHMDVLLELDCIELTDSRQQRGGRVVEHFFRAKKLPYFNQEAWEQLELQGKWEVVIPIMRLISANVNEAMAGGTFLDPDDNHVSRTPMLVDKEGWEETKEALADVLTRLLEIKDNVNARYADGAEATTMAIKVAMIQFRSPDRDKDIGANAY
jgi:DNA-binding transcriptional ArsR family regulator